MNYCNVTTNRQPGIGYYVDLGGKAEIYIVPDTGASHAGDMFEV